MNGGEVPDTKSNDLCQFGAAGTIYFNRTHTLIVKNIRSDLNNTIGRSKQTPLKNRIQKDYISENIRAEGHATITFKPAVDQDYVKFTNLVLHDNSTFFEPILEKPHIKYEINGTNISLLNDSRLILGVNGERSIVNLDGNFTMDETSHVLYDRALEINSIESLLIYGDLEYYQKYANDLGDLTLDENYTNSTNLTATILNLTAVTTELSIILSSSKSLIIGPRVEIDCYS